MVTNGHFRKNHLPFALWVNNFVKFGKSYIHINIVKANVKAFFSPSNNTRNSVIQPSTGIGPKSMYVAKYWNDWWLVVKDQSNIAIAGFSRNLFKQCA